MPTHPRVINNAAVLNQQWCWSEGANFQKFPSSKFYPHWFFLTLEFIMYNILLYMAIYCYTRWIMTKFCILMLFEYWDVFWPHQKKAAETKGECLNCSTNQLTFSNSLSTKRFWFSKMEKFQMFISILQNLVISHPSFKSQLWSEDLKKKCNT